MFSLEREMKLPKMKATPNKNGNTYAIQMITPIKIRESVLFCFQERRYQFT